MREDFETKLQSFYEGCQRITAEHLGQYAPNVTPRVWRLPGLSSLTQASGVNPPGPSLAKFNS